MQSNASWKSNQIKNFDLKLKNEQHLFPAS